MKRKKLKSVKKRSRSKIKRKSKSVKRRSRSNTRCKDNGLSDVLKKLKNENHENEDENEDENETEKHENILKKILKKILEKIDSIENNQKRIYSIENNRKRIENKQKRNYAYRPDYLSYYAWADPDKYMDMIKDMPTTTNIPLSANLV
jgi:hypothetical protein